LAAATVCTSGVKFCDPEDVFPLANLSVSSIVKHPRLSLQSCLLLTKERRIVKIIGTVKTEKKLQKKSLQQNSNNHEQDDEFSASSGKKEN
jgi:hypothetical protein